MPEKKRRHRTPSGLEIAGIPENPVEQALFLLEKWTEFCGFPGSEPHSKDELACSHEKGQAIFRAWLERIFQRDPSVSLTTQAVFNLCAQKPKVCRRLFVWGIINPTFFDETEANREFPAPEVLDEDASGMTQEESEQGSEANVLLLQICPLLRPLILALRKTPRVSYLK